MIEENILHIPEVNHPSTLASRLYFERTGKFRLRPSDATREELLDLTTKLINDMESLNGSLEKLLKESSVNLGWESQT